MAIFDAREYTTRTYEWAVPTGCPAEEFDKAWAVALITYRRVHNLPEDAAPDDGGWLRVYAMDDEVVLRFDVREGGR
ncbi:hypothetical protein [Micromonospora sp. NPDC050695]|uniref:hypothetical protein n=1 Tax=Micromonospora sp. NPDC050695 TaxID=3154938 RepID=UPI00340222FA